MSFISVVWYVPGIKRNLFSELAAQDMNPNSVFESHVESCTMKIGSKVIVTGKRLKHGGLFTLNCKALIPMPSTMCQYRRKICYKYTMSGLDIKTKGMSVILLNENWE